MTSYCEVCQGLFSMPHPHDGESDSYSMKNHNRGNAHDSTGGGTCGPYTSPLACSSLLPVAEPMVSTGGAVRTHHGDHRGRAHGYYPEGKWAAQRRHSQRARSAHTLLPNDEGGIREDQARTRTSRSPAATLSRGRRAASMPRPSRRRSFSCNDTPSSRNPDGRHQCPCMMATCPCGCVVDREEGRCHERRCADRQGTSGGANPQERFASGTFNSKQRAASVQPLRLCSTASRAASGGNRHGRHGSVGHSGRNARTTSPRRRGGADSRHRHYFDDDRRRDRGEQGNTATPGTASSSSRSSTAAGSPPTADSSSTVPTRGRTRRSRSRGHRSRSAGRDGNQDSGSSGQDGLVDDFSPAALHDILDRMRQVVRQQRRQQHETEEEEDGEEALTSNSPRHARVGGGHEHDERRGCEGREEVVDGGHLSSHPPQPSPGSRLVDRNSSKWETLHQTSAFLRKYPRVDAATSAAGAASVDRGSKSGNHHNNNRKRNSKSRSTDREGSSDAADRQHLLPPTFPSHDGPSATEDDSNTAASQATSSSSPSSLPPTHHPTAGRDASMWYRQLKLTQQAAHHAQERKVEELRQGFVDLCSAVRDDLRAIEERLDGKIGAETSRLMRENSALLASSRPAALSGDHTAAAAAAGNHQLERGGSGRAEQQPLQLKAILKAVRAATREEKQSLVDALAPELHDVIQGRVHAAMQAQYASHTAWLQHQTDSMEADMQAALQAQASRLQTRWRQDLHQALPYLSSYDGHHHHPDAGLGDGGSSADSVTGADHHQQGEAAAARVSSRSRGGYTAVGEVFSSSEAFEAHIRAAARAVLAEEDHYRYETAALAVRKEQDIFQARLQAHTEERLRTALAALEERVHHATVARMAKERERVKASALDPMRRQLAATMDAVQSLTEDLAKLSHQQDSLVRVVSTEGDKRKRGRSDAPATAPAATTAPVLSPEAFATADAIRLDVVQPALEHVKRLLAAHQRMLDTVVEQRCQRAETAAEENRHVWEQNVVELRAKLNALRSNVRGAFAELCQNLNVAAPGL